MKKREWKQDGAYSQQSDCGRFYIAKAVCGGRLAYTATRCRGAGGGDILHVERDIDPDDSNAIKAAIKRCREACRDETDAEG